MTDSRDINKKREQYAEYLPLSFPVPGAGGETGSWRMLRPEVNHEKCIRCQLCWIYCPDGLIDREKTTIDYQYCKGCGICAAECPVNAIKMVREG